MGKIGEINIKELIIEEFPEIEQDKNIHITDLVQDIIDGVDFKSKEEIIKNQVKAIVEKNIQLSKRKKIASLLNKKLIPERAFNELKEKLSRTPYIYKEIIKILENINNGIYITVVYNNEEHRFNGLEYSEEMNKFKAIINDNKIVDIEDLTFPS